MAKKGDKWVFGRGQGGDGNNYKTVMDRPPKYYSAVWEAAKRIGESTPLFSVPNPFHNDAILKKGYTVTARTYIFPVMFRWNGKVYVVIWKPTRLRKLFKQMQEKVARFYGMEIIWVKRKRYLTAQEAEIFLRRELVKRKREEEENADE